MTDNLQPTDQKEGANFLEALKEANRLMSQVDKADIFNMKTVVGQINSFLDSEEGKDMMVKVNERSRYFLQGKSIDEVVEAEREKKLMGKPFDKRYLLSNILIDGTFPKTRAYRELSIAIGEEPLSAEDRALKEFADNYRLALLKPLFF